MKNFTLLFFSLFMVTFLYAQQTIKGKVISAANGKPVWGSSIFLSSTSIGTVSDSSGNFELNNIPNGRYDLIVSSIGYETHVTSFSSEQLPWDLKIELKEKIKTLENVTVEPYEEGKWSQWGNLFVEAFLGRTPNAARCKIVNNKAIRFRYFKKSRRLIAYCDEPIVIENKALGYRITYQLENFEVDLRQGTSMYAGFSFFEDMAEKIRNKWIGERDKAYYGSVMHFMRSLYADSLLQNGFEVHRMVRQPNSEKERVKKIYQPHNNTQNLPQDSFIYYQQVMRQSDFSDIHHKAVLTADSLLTQAEGEYKQFFFTDFLYVIYRRELENRAYLMYAQGNSPFSRKPMHQSSYLFLYSGQPLYVNAYGHYYPPQELFCMAYWAWSDKIGDMLPLDYQPSGLD